MARVHYLPFFFVHNSIVTLSFLPTSPISAAVNRPTLCTTTRAATHASQDVTTDGFFKPALAQSGNS